MYLLHLHLLSISFLLFKIFISPSLEVHKGRGGRGEGDNEEEGDVILSTYIAVVVVVAQDMGHTLVVYEDLSM